MKKSTPRTFNNVARSGSKSRHQNSGMFSNSGKGQKHDSTPKPSPSSGPVGSRKKADVKALRKAVSVPKKKTSMPKSGKNAQTVANYATRHGEKG